MRERKEAAEDFYEAMGWVAGESGPDWVSDEATVLDLLDGAEDEQFVTDRVRAKYGVELTPAHFDLPFWLLLERLPSRCA